MTNDPAGDHLFDPAPWTYEPIPESEAIREVQLPDVTLSIHLDVNDLFLNWESAKGRLDDVISFLERVRDVFKPEDAG